VAISPRKGIGEKKWRVRPRRPGEAIKKNRTKNYSRGKFGGRGRREPVESQGKKVPTPINLLGRAGLPKENTTKLEKGGRKSFERERNAAGERGSG